MDHSGTPPKGDVPGIDSSGPDSLAERNRPATPLNRPVFYVSAAIVVAIAVWALLAPDTANTVIGSISSWTTKTFGWWYFALATAVVVFVVGLALSRFGTIRLGPDDSRPEYNLFSWTAMLFAAGIGLDLMFFSVAEPISHYLQPPEGAGETVPAAREAVTWTLFHYGITGWAFYAVMGMAMAYFAFRMDLPLAIRSALVPILGKRAEGLFGDTVDVAAVVGTIFGIATSLGIGIVQLNFGLGMMFGISQGKAAQIGLIVLSVVMATISAVAGVDKGIRRLSELNVYLALFLLVFVLVTGKTGFLLNGLVQNVGDYAQSFVGRSLDTMAWTDPTDWKTAWTLFFWAWWVAWATFVGLFLARISRGRTIRQFVAGVLTIPFGFILVWISIFGNSAVDAVRDGGKAFGDQTVDNPASGFYTLLSHYPWATFLVGLATVTGLLFYVTSADSGALVLGNFTSRITDPRQDCRRGVRVFWSVAIGVLTLAMLFAGGGDGSILTLQQATIIMGLPFSFVIVLVMLGLLRALNAEGLKQVSVRGALHGISASHRAEALDWRTRIRRSVAYPDRAATQRFLEQVCTPTLETAAEEFRAQNYEARVDQVDAEGRVLPCPTLTVSFDPQPDFVYGIHPVPFHTPTYATLTRRERDVYFRSEVHLSEGGQDYDVNGYTRTQLMGDLLDQFEHHLGYLHLMAGSGGAARAAVNLDDDPAAGGTVAPRDEHADRTDSEGE